MTHQQLAEELPSIMIMVFATGLLIGSLISILSLVILDWLKEARLRREKNHTRVSIV